MKGGEGRKEGRKIDREGMDGGRKGREEGKEGRDGMEGGRKEEREGEMKGKREGGRKRKERRKKKERKTALLQLYGTVVPKCVCCSLKHHCVARDCISSS
jgi:hypothetical protein